jgi:Family of unknown function (DUF6533)
MQSAVEQLILVLVPMRAARLTCAAAGTVLLYDILITTPEEIRFIWPSKFSLPKCLYFMVSPCVPTMAVLTLAYARIAIFPFHV